MAQVALGVVGGAIGFMLGGPAGAAIGFGIGMALTPEMPGATIGEIAKQTAKEGDPRLIVWGIVRPVGPNIIACEDPPRTYQVSQGGKGSGPTSEAIYRTYALGVCEGPITGYRRIWRNNKLVYDGRNGSAWGAINNPVFLQKATFYYGTYTQMPDPNLEAVFGVGEVPAHRGTAYIVIADEDLTDTGGAVPQWLFEVVRAQYEYDSESTELLIAHGSNPNLTVIDTQEWSVMEQIGGNGSSYGGAYTSDMNRVVSALGVNSKVYGRDSGIEIHSESVGSIATGGIHPDSERNSFAYILPASPYISIMNEMEFDGGHSYSVSSPPSPIAVEGHDGAYSPESLTLAVAHSRSYYEEEEGEEGEYYIATFYGVFGGYQRVGGFAPPVENGDLHAYSVCWHPTLVKAYVGSSSGRIYVINPAEGSIIYEIGPYTSSIDSIAIHPSGIYFAAGLADGRVIFFSDSAYSAYQSVSNSGYSVSDLSFSPGGTLVGVCLNPTIGSNQAKVLVLSTEDFSEVYTLDDPGGTIRSIDWSPLQPVGL